MVTFPSGIIRLANSGTILNFYFLLSIGSIVIHKSDIVCNFFPLRNQHKFAFCVLNIPNDRFLKPIVANLNGDTIGVQQTPISAAQFPTKESVTWANRFVACNCNFAQMRVARFNSVRMTILISVDRCTLSTIRIISDCIVNGICHNAYINSPILASLKCSGNSVVKLSNFPIRTKCFVNLVDRFNASRMIKASPRNITCGNMHFKFGNHIPIVGMESHAVFAILLLQCARLSTESIRQIDTWRGFCKNKGKIVVVIVRILLPRQRV